MKFIKERPAWCLALVAIVAFAVIVRFGSGPGAALCAIGFGLIVMAALAAAVDDDDDQGSAR